MVNIEREREREGGGERERKKERGRERERECVLVMSDKTKNVPALKSGGFGPRRGLPLVLSHSLTSPLPFSYTHVVSVCVARYR